MPLQAQAEPNHLEPDTQATLWHKMHLAPHGQCADVIYDAAIVVQHGRILWLGAELDLPLAYRALPAQQKHDCGGLWMTPGLVDCHTHLVYAGNRADEFSRRLAGASYEDIARSGGGILSTVRATRMADEASLFAQSARRLEALLMEGVTLVEIKSGYGLDFATERKILRVARQLAQHYPVHICTTFLGAHALPPEYHGRADDYIQLVCEDMLPRLHAEGLVDAVDVFCENIGFTLAQSERVFQAAAALGLPVKMHAEQLSNLGGSQLAARYQALSVDHLEHLNEADIIALKAAGTVAVLLPGAYYFLRETCLPPIALLRQHQIPLAIASDSNPGTSPSTSLLLMLNMGATLFRLTVDECLSGVTGNAARALGMAEQHGSLAVGRRADCALWDVETLAELVYWSGLPRCRAVALNGVFYQKNLSSERAYHEPRL